MSLLLAAALASAINFAEYSLVQFRLGLLYPVGINDLAGMLFIYGLLFLPWILGLTVFGGPVWAVLHEAGKRQWYHAMLAGFCVPFIVLLVANTGFLTGQSASGHFSLYANGGRQWVDGQMTAFGWYVAFRSAAITGSFGTILGLLIWYAAYRRV